MRTVSRTAASGSARHSSRPRRNQYRETSRSLSARPAAVSALRLQPSRFSAVYLRGQAERLGGDLRAASRSMRRALALQPSDLSAAVLAASTALQQGELEEAAAESLRRAIALLKESGALRPDLEATLQRLESGRKAIDPAIFAPRAVRF